MARDYLRQCLNLFAGVSKELSGKQFDLEVLEEKVKTLRSGEIRVRAILEHFGHFKNTEHWWFDKYWILPSLHDLSREQQRKTFSFHQLSRGNEGKPNEQKVISDLVEVFRHIELVSIILRFIRPESFGILSPPVEHVLALSRGRDHVETYLNYLKDLRSIRNESQYELRTAAETDMALWVLEHKCYFKKMMDVEIKQEFEEDEFMLQLRARNLVTPLQNLSSARLASALYSQKDLNRLTSLVGCYALEENVKHWTHKENVEKEAKRLAQKERPTLADRIEALAARGKLTELERGRLERLKNIRNQVFHAEVEKLALHDARDLVHTALEIEHRLKQRRTADG